MPLAATAFASAGDAHAIDSFTRQLYVPWYDAYGNIMKIGGGCPQYI